METLETPPSAGEGGTAPQPREQALGEPQKETTPIVAKKAAVVRQKALALSERESEAWQRTIENVVRSVVSVRFCQPCSFETSSTRSSQASGFVVDAENGYILTNRHVVGAGPFWGHVIFSNQEEVDAYPIYRDPIHDFGILRFDPKAVKYMDIQPLQLRPDLAKVGVEIRVIGNDGGEKLSILSGFISRLDRNAPKYRGYRDFNTCYYQANAAATGGSSGSPVVNVDGYAIALQAGGRADKASTDFFLPLNAPLRALERIQKGLPIPRGDIQCTFLLKPFDVCRRLGLTSNWETAIREAYPQENNMLVAECVLPEGPSDQKIEEGDIVIKVNGQLVAQFLALDEIFDARIGEKVQVLVQRGGADIELEVLVEDIWKITPGRFLAVAGASFHDLPYQLATKYAIPCRGVYVCESGLFSITERNGCVVLAVDYKPTPNLDSFAEVMKDIPDKARVVVSYKKLSDLHTTHTSLVRINRHWTPKMKMVSRNDNTGQWDFEELGDALPPKPPVRSKARFKGLNHIAHSCVADIARSFVHVESKLPFWIDGVKTKNQARMGVVVDADRGLVLVTRDVVPNSLCDIFITIADSIFVEGKVVFLHPSQNYSIIQYDPELVDAPILSAKLGTERATQGASALFVGYDDNRRMFYAPTIVTGTSAIDVDPSSPPRYRPMNMEGITVDTSLGDMCDSGVLLTMDGDVQAFWLSYDGDSEVNFGLDAPSVMPVISQIREGVVPKLRILPVELEAIPLLQARGMGVTEEWAEKAEEHSPHHQLFMVKRVFNERSDQLLEGDVLLTLNGEIAGNAAELSAMYWHETLEAVVMRQGQEQTIKLTTMVDDDMETSHIVILCGAIIQKPHRAVRQQIKELPSEVYVAGRYYGAPSSLYGLWSTYFITHLNHKPTPTLEELVSRAKEIPDNEYFRIKGVTYDNSPFVITLKKNERFFPTAEWLRVSEEPWRWRYRTYENGEAVEGDGKFGVWI